MLNFIIIVIVILTLVSPYLIKLIQRIQNYGQIRLWWTNILDIISGAGGKSSSVYRHEKIHDDSDNNNNNNNNRSQRLLSSSSLSSITTILRLRKSEGRISSKLNNYLEKNLFNYNNNHNNLNNQHSDNNNNLQFQSNYPWKTLVMQLDTKNWGKVLSLNQTELRLFESIFEIILTEKSYLMVFVYLFTILILIS